MEIERTGEKIKAAREQAGITQAALAKLIGTTPQNISQYERNIRKPKYKTLQKIARALNVEIHELMTKDEIMSENFTKALNKTVETIITVAEEDNHLLYVYHLMNETGRNKALSLIEDLSKVPEYQRQQAKQDAPADTDNVEPAE